MKDYNLYWERCWQEEESAELYKYLDRYCGIKRLMCLRNIMWLTCVMLPVVLEHTLWRLQYIRYRLHGWIF